MVALEYSATLHDLTQAGVALIVLVAFGLPTLLGLLALPLLFTRRGRRHFLDPPRPTGNAAE